MKPTELNCFASCLVAGIDFEGLLIKPKEVQEGVKLPLIVSPHGEYPRR